MSTRVDAHFVMILDILQECPSVIILIPEFVSSIYVLLYGFYSSEGFVHSLTAPCVSPWIIRFWKTSAIRMTGIEEITDAAMM